MIGLFPEVLREGICVVVGVTAGGSRSGSLR